MKDQPIAREIVLFQTTVGLFIGIVCFNPVYETIKFVLEKKEFFEVEWPALVNIKENGLVPILLGIPYITLQRNHVVWYTLEIPELLLTIYQRTVPQTFNLLKQPLPNTSKLAEKNQQDISKSEEKKTEEKIIPFPGKKKE